MKHSINYIYFGALFILIFIFTASGIFHKSALAGSETFFLIYALGQVVLEITFLILLSMLIQRHLGKFFNYTFIGFTFIALFLHFFDFLMERILDLSVWQALRIFVLDEDLENFFYLLDASGISLWIWFSFFGLLACLPFLGLLVYNLTHRVANKKPLQAHPSHLLQVVALVPLALLFWDSSASKIIHPDTYTAFTTSLPFKGTFLEPKKALYPSGYVKKPIDEKDLSLLIKEDKSQIQSLPNIYLFITESLRRDVITEQIAPNLYHFQNQSFSFEHATSGGNGTDISWFTIFHSQFPYFRKLRQTQNWEMGSPALNLLKKWGYQIRVYTSAKLEYYGMHELLFGRNEFLIDEKKEFPHSGDLTAAETDRQAITSLLKDVHSNPVKQEGQIYIIFWDTTHFDYTWGNEWKPKFVPIAKELAYFKAFHSKKTIQHIKNKYMSSVNYMDHLFGTFLKNVPKSDDAIIIFTGDHGEEFFDQGHLFHNSHLSKQQIHIPLFMKFGNLPKQSQKIVSQVDIFPSILDYLSGKTFSFLEGASVFRNNTWPFAVTARFNAGRTPYEFSVHNGKYKFIGQFLNRNQIFEENQLKIISLRTVDDQRVDVENPSQWLKTEFEGAFKRLFQSD